MPRKGKGSKPTKGRNNSKNNSHIGSPSISRKPIPIQTHHVGTVHLDFGDNSSGVVQPKEGKHETTSIQSSQHAESGSREGEKMADRKDHAEGTGENT